MNIIYAIVAFAIIGISIAGYLFCTRDTYIVRINKNNIMEFKTSMELTGLPIITFNQGKNKYNFLLDTGSNISYITKNVEIEYITTGEKSTFIGAEGRDIDCEDVCIKLYRNSVEYDCNVAMADLSAAFTELKNNYGVTIVGILGNNFFTKYKYCLDFKELVAYVRK